MIFGPYPAVVVDWHDGDTCHINIDLGFGIILSSHNLNGTPMLSCRVYGINAPELSTDSGKDALLYAATICPMGTHVTVVSHGWDKYGGRWDGSITLPNGQDFAQMMLASGHALPLLGP